jgi:cytochrome c-type biogenesis protein CcmF
VPSSTDPAAAASVAAGRWTPLSALATLLGAWIIAASVAATRARLGPSPPELAQRLARLAASRAFVGMQVAHAGVGVFVLGVALVTAGAIDVDAAMSPGDRAAAGAYEFRFDGIEEVAGPNYVAARATLRVYRADREVAVLQPEKRAYVGSAMPMTEAAIDYGLTRHLYVSLGEALSGGAWAMRAQVKPFAGFIWMGCLLMALGGLLSLSDARYRRGAVQRQTPDPALHPPLESAPRVQ